MFDASCGAYDVQYHTCPVYCCPAGPPDSSIEQQWQVLDQAADVIATAPDDEISAELLMLQGELLHQIAINRSRLAKVLAAVVSDVPSQTAAAAERQQWEEELAVYIQVGVSLAKHEPFFHSSLHMSLHMNVSLQSAIILSC